MCVCVCVCVCVCGGGVVHVKITSGILSPVNKMRESLSILQTHKGHYTHLYSSFKILSCHPRVIVTSPFAYKVISDLESIDHLCSNHIRRIGLLHK